MANHNQIMTNLPASEESFLKSKPQRTLRLTDVINGEGVSTLAPFACVIVLTSLFGRNLVHIHRPQPHDNDHDLNGEFWKRHRSHDNILLHIALSLPDHLRLPSGMTDVNVIFANMSIHTSTICLHQAAIFKAEKNKMPNQITIESKRRCLVAANQISSIMKMISHVDLTSVGPHDPSRTTFTDHLQLNPFMSFCLYIAARVFVQYLKSRPEDSSVQSSLQFLVSALNAMKNKNPLTESFLVQLDVDLDGTGIRALDDRQVSKNAAHSMLVRLLDSPLEDREPLTNTFQKSYCNEAPDCPPVTNIRGTAPTKEQSQRDANRPTYQQPTPSLATSLPSRYKESATQPAGGPAFSGDDNRHPFDRSPINQMEQADPGTIVDMDMDFSPDFGNLSDRNNPPSDHPTPSTLNSSSNTSYSLTGAEDAPPGTKKQKSTNHPNQGSGLPFDKLNSIHMPSEIPNPQAAGMNSMNARFYPSSSGSPVIPTDPSTAFSAPPTWGLPDQMPQMGNLDLGNLSMENFSESQWAQILGTQVLGESPSGGANPGWEDWRPS